jgi:hypothetical protein
MAYFYLNTQITFSMLQKTEWHHRFLWSLRWVGLGFCGFSAGFPWVSAGEPWVDVF